MGDKFIPNGDIDFALMAERFAKEIAKEPARFTVTQRDSDQLSAAVAAFRTALNAARASRSTIATRTKGLAREEAEKIIRRLANGIRANDQIDEVSKMQLHLRQRPSSTKQQSCPPAPPRLRFVRALHEGGGATPMHELAFSDLSKPGFGKPAGAVRLELFVDLIPPDEPIPTHPGANHNGRPWYLRSFTRSPIILTPPMTRVPMRVIYWGRWADSMGNVGPFSATAVAWIEGGSLHNLPGGIGTAVPGARNPAPLLEDATASTQREQRISVVLLEAQYQSMNETANQSFYSHALVDETPQLPAPVDEEAA